MSHSTRSLIALATAGILLAGSGATFARWYDEASVGGGQVSTGTLSLSAASTPTWMINTAAQDQTVTPSVPFNPATDKIVPGDVVHYTTDVTLHLSGKNLHASLGVNPEEGVDLDGLSVSPSYDCGDVNLADLTEADDGTTCHVTVTVEYPFGAGNEHSAIIENEGDGAHGQGWEKAPAARAVTVPQFSVVLEQNLRPAR